MATIKPRVKELLEKFGLDPRQSLWDCHGTWVLYHAACQVIANKLDIRFDEPEVVQMNLADKQVVIKVHGRLPDGISRWDFGEALPGNCKNAYPVSMALKRAEDKVILHLAQLRQHGIYSDQEAEEFKRKPSNRREADNAKNIITLIREATTTKNVEAIMSGHTDQLMELPAVVQRQIKKAREDKLSSL